MSSDLLMNYAVISLFRIALDCRAALTSNSEHAMVKTEEHACCSKSKAPDIFSSDVDWELSGVGLALRNWDSAYNSEGGRFGVNAAI